MDTFFERWEKYIREHDKPHTEIEIRLGKMNRGTFDTNITQETYEKVLRRLKKYTGWEDVSESDVSHFYYPKNRRATYDNVKEDIIACITKKRLFVDDVSLTNQPLDIRLGVSSEIPCDHSEDEDYTKIRNVKRTSFLRKNLRIDVSVVSGDPDDHDSENEVEYHIELEIVKVPEKPHELYNMVYKIFDVLKITQ